VGYTNKEFGQIWHFNGKEWKKSAYSKGKSTDFIKIAFMDSQNGIVVSKKKKAWQWDGRTWKDITSKVALGWWQHLSHIYDIDANRAGNEYIFTTGTGTKDKHLTDNITSWTCFNIKANNVTNNTGNLDQPKNTIRSETFFLYDGSYYILNCSTDEIFLDRSSDRSTLKLQYHDIPNTFWMVDQEEGWLIGDNGIVIHLTTGEKTEASWPTSRKLNGIWMLDKDIGFIVGDKGTVLGLSTPEAVSLKLTMKEETIDHTENVQFILEKASNLGKASMQDYYYEIKRIEGNQIKETVFTSKKGKDFRTVEKALNNGKKVGFGWNKKDNNGKLVTWGDYKVEFHAMDRKLQARFTLATPPSDTPDGQPAYGGLLFSMEKTDLEPDDQVIFTLKNGISQTIDLEGYYFVIERYKKKKKSKDRSARPTSEEDNWKIFYKSKKNIFKKLSLESGKTKKWAWNRKGSKDKKKVETGSYRIKFYAPKATNSVLQVEFNLHKGKREGTTAQREKKK
jgi:hypothetical protein